MCLIGVVVAAVSVTQGLGTVAVSATPELGLQVAPWHAQAKGRVAERVYSADTSKAGQTKALALATSTLRRDLTSVQALRTLGIMKHLGQNPKAGQKLLMLADKITRRDLALNIVLIEIAVAEEDIPLALRHYDQALRTSEGSAATLMPILAGATDEPTVIEPLADILARKPQWLFPFYVEMIKSAPSPRTLTSLSAAMAKRGQPFAPDIRSGLITRLIAANELALVREEYRRGVKAGTIPDSLLDGRFRRVGKILPIDWALADTGVSGVGEGPSLSYEVGARRDAELARQYLQLSPGPLQISLRIRGPNPGRAYAQVDCAGGTGQTLLRRPDWAAGQNSARFTVPPGCASQWLTLRVDAGDGDAAGAITSLTLSSSTISLQAGTSE